MTIKKQIEKDLGAVFTMLGFNKKFAFVSASQISGVDYQCNACFQLAKLTKQNPADIADTIVKKFTSMVATATVSKPAFINFTITDAALSSMAVKVLKTKKIPLEKQPKRTVFFDYGGANVAKELHIGHLRPPIVGEALRRVFRAFGHKTIGDTHLGDFGLHMGLIMAELENPHPSGTPFRKGEYPEITLELLNEIYPRASKRKNEDEAFKARAAEIVLLKQNKKEPYYSTWQKIKQVSIPKIRENYLRLNCTFDTFEGDNCEYAPEMFAALKPESTFISDGCIVMDISNKRDPKEMPPALLQKRDGAVLYLTGDMATVHRREKLYRPDQYIYVIDARQSLHMEQLFRAVKKGGIAPAKTKFVHVALGTVNGSDGKPFKTRAGGTIKLEDVFDIVTEGARKRLNESGRQFDETTAQRIGFAALKFADLQSHVKSGYIFDIDKFTDFNGKTGPYLLYTVARINSILASLKEATDTDVRENFPSKCRPVLAKIVKLIDAFTWVTNNYSLNGLTDALYELAAEFNNFYAQTNILYEKDDDTRASYITMCRVVKIVMEYALDVLAIDPVERM